MITTERASSHDKSDLLYATRRVSTALEPRVLFLADHLGHPGGAVHGVTTYLLEVLPALKAAGVPVAACFLREPHPAAARLREFDIETQFLSLPRLDPRGVMSVMQIMERGHYSILHATQLESSLVARLVAHKLGRVAVLHVHDMTDPPLPLRWLASMVASPEDCGICTSWATRPLAMNGYHLNPNRIRVLYPGIDAAPFRQVTPADGERLRAELGIAPTTAVLSMIARFYPVKGHRGMLRIFCGVVARLPDSVLLLAGDGPERRACESVAKELGIAAKVKFLGNRSDVPNILAATDVVVVPSLSEGLGLSAVEAHLCGRPVVAYRTGGLPEVLVNEDCGRLVPLGNESTFVDEIVEVLREERRSRPSRVTERKRLAAERFDLDTHVRRLKDFYGAVSA